MDGLLTPAEQDELVLTGVDYMVFPSIADVETADREQLILWWRYLRPTRNVTEAIRFGRIEQRLRDTYPKE